MASFVQVDSIQPYVPYIKKNRYFLPLSILIVIIVVVIALILYFRWRRIESGLCYENEDCPGDSLCKNDGTCTTCLRNADCGSGQICSPANSCINLP